MSTLEPPPFPLSPTALNTMLTCPKQFEAKYVTKEVQFVPTAQSLKGREIHKHLEDRVNGTPLPGDLAFMEPVMQKIDRLREAGWTVYPEYQLRINKDYQAVRYSKGSWQNAKADVVLVHVPTHRVVIIDWKTGKGKTDGDLKRWGVPREVEVQSDMLALCALNVFRADRVDTKFVYMYDRPGAEPVAPITAIYGKGGSFERHMKRVAEFEINWGNQKFTPKPNGLCAEWCDVKSCPHNGRGG